MSDQEQFDEYDNDFLDEGFAEDELEISDEIRRRVPSIKPRRRAPIYPRNLECSGLYQHQAILRYSQLSGADSFDEFAEAENELSPSRGLGRRKRRFTEELRLDVDGRYPQMQASGKIRTSAFSSVHWIARLIRSSNGSKYKGKIWYKDGAANTMRHTHVLIHVKRSWFPHQRRLKAMFYGGGAPKRVAQFRYKSKYFHPVELEFDRVSDVAAADATTSINTCDHPNRPGTIACENLSLEKVFSRTGFDVKKSGSDSVIPVAEAGTNTTWSNAEMHDAMQAYWSRFDNRSQWSLWTLFARQSDSGTSLGGIMFDSIGPNHRQGTAIFSDSFISTPPAGESNPTAWVERMRMWTAAHEMGHAFNLAHSWQKSLGNPWLLLANENEARSFMNYPYFVSGGESSFFSDFEYRFSDSELLFMRHAPASFVQMGNADWFEDHGFEQAIAEQSGDLRLSIRLNRPSNVVEFLEMINLEMKLTNTSAQTCVVDKDLLQEYDSMAVIVKRDGAVARQWIPFSHELRKGSKIGLDSNQSLYDSILLSSGVNGWDISEPGNYTIQIMMSVDDEVVVSNALRLRVMTPKTNDEEILAQDLFTKEVGQVLTFGGSMYLSEANNALQEVVLRKPDSAAATHAQIALALPHMRNFKSLTIKEDASDLFTALENKQARVSVGKANAKAVNAAFDVALIKNADAAAQTLGHICYKKHMDSYSKYIGETEKNLAAKHTQLCHKTLSARGVPDWVFAQDAQLIDSATSLKGTKKKTSKA